MPAGPRLLLTQRNTALLLERARIRLDADRVVYDKAEGQSERVFNIPFANLAVLFLGQGTSITQGAARALAEEKVYVAFTGTDGAPLHYGSLTTYAPTRFIHDMYRVSCSGLALDAAKILMDKRLELVSKISDQVCANVGLKQAPGNATFLAANARDRIRSISSSDGLMSFEGKITKEFYKAYASQVGIRAFARSHGDRDFSTIEGVVNARLDHGNYIAYGLAGATLWSLGLPASLSVFHGKTRAGGLVFDLADAFKDAIVLPAAFGIYADQSEFRSKLMDLVHDHKILALCFSLMEEILAMGKEDQS